MNLFLTELVLDPKFAVGVATIHGHPVRFLRLEHPRYGTLDFEFTDELLDAIKKVAADPVTITIKPVGSST